MYILRWFVLIPLLNNLFFEPQLTEDYFLYLVLATVFIAAAGYIINDYFDRKTDLINRPGEVILGRILRLRAGMFWHSFLTATGILLGTYVAYKTGILKMGFIFFIMSGLLWFYSTTYKRQVLLGNIIVALMVAAVPLIVLFFELPLLAEKYSFYINRLQTNIDLLIVWIIANAIFAFLLTFIREIIKDLEDFEGDAAFGRNTIPVAWGPMVAKSIAITSACATIVLILVPVFKYRWSLITLLYSLFLILIPLAVFVYLTIRAQLKSNYHKASFLLKLIMLSGLLFNIVARYYLF
jgi:4-hydroxybenzoate polyprenyltransferase